MKKNGGFTLLEVIIAIAAMSVISVYILQMFIASATLNARAKNTDIAVTRAVAEIENLKKHTSLSSYLDDNDKASGDSSAVEVIIYYDTNWNSTESNAQTNAKYYLKMEITAADSLPQDTEDAVYGILYNVKTEVIDRNAKENSQTLTSMQTKKYFPR